MRTRLRCFLIVVAWLVSGLAQPGWSGEVQGTSPEEAALRARAEVFMAAFNTGDAIALAACWTADGDYLDQAGHHLQGRQAIEQAYQQLFAAHPGLKLDITVTSLRVLTPDVAIEDGTTDLLPADSGPPSRARYTVIHVKHEGQWRLASVREAAFVPPSQYDYLQELEWLIGDWRDAGDTAEGTRMSFAWADQQNFIVASLTTTLKDIRVSRATQWIGWDPVAQQIRSWSFELSGGFGEGIWTKEGNQWIIKTTSTLPDGKQMSATNVITPVDGETVTWQSQELTVGGTTIPGTKEGTLKRLQ